MVNTAARATSPPILNPLQTQNINVTSSSSLQQYYTLPSGSNGGGSGSGSGGSSSINIQNNSKQFCDNFWGDKINGFDVLCQNLKHSLTSVKDLETFLRESANCEDSYGKVLNKLVTQINRFSSNGSFNPLWSPLKELNEKYSLKHVEMVHSLHELIKDIQRYNEELSKKIKRIRENEIQTQTIVQNFQDIQLNLNKTKEQYHNLCIEFEKQKRQLDPQQMAQYQQLQLQQQISSTNLLSTNNNGINNSNNVNAAGSLLINGSSIGSTSISTGSTSFTPNLLTSTNPTNNITNINNTSSVNLQLIATSNSSGLQQQLSSGGQQSASPAPTTTTSSTTDRLSSLASSITVSKVSQVQKIEKKLRLSLEEYKSTLDKYNSIRIEFERKLADSCNHFQYTEETHLKQMRVFIESYSKLISNCNANKQQIYNDFHMKFEQFTSDYLLKLFVENKGTGTERPEMALFIDQFDYAKLNNNLNNNNNNNNIVSTNTNQTLINETDFNLFINGGNQFTNTSLNTSYSTNTNNNNNNLLPPPPPPMPLAGVQQISSSNTNDSVDNRSTSDQQSRGTPIFFSSSNIMSGVSNSFYAPLTNSVSTTTLNSITQNTSAAVAAVGTTTMSNNVINSVSGVNNFGTASPINVQHSITPTNIPTTNTTSTNNENMKRSDSKGINIFNVDFLGRKNKEKKAKAAAAAAAAAALSAQQQNEQLAQQQQQQQQSTSKANKASKSNKKAKQQQQQQNMSTSSNSTSTNQYENLNSSTSTTTNGMFLNTGLSNISNNSNRDSSSINSEDSNERVTTTTTTITTTNVEQIVINSDNHHHQHQQQQNGGSITARSISSITGSLSFDLLDQLNINKLSNGGNGGNGGGSDIDSEGYSIRPESSMGQRSRMTRKKDNGEPLRNKDNEDMNNLYASSSTTNSDDSDDSDSDDNGGDGMGGGPRKVNIKINPLTKDDKDQKQKTTINDDVLREISKNLQLIKPNSNNNSQLGGGKQTNKKRTYYYNYGTANPNQATSGWSTTSNLMNSPDVISKPSLSETNDSMMMMHRSISVGSVVQSNNSLFDDFKFGPAITSNATSTTKQQTTDSLFDFGINFPPKSSTTTPTNPTVANVPVSISMNKVTDTNLYNIEEDKEVESSFQYDLKRQNQYVSSSSPANTNTTTTTTTNSSNSINGTGGAGGRFTPACFPGRTTPDFRITTSLFEQQGTRASIISPLTVNNTVGCDTIIPIAVAFNETIHAYFKTGDTAKFKVKCFGCMKISFPFAVLKYLNTELPQFEFRLNNLQIANQDLKINNQLLNRITTTSDQQFGGMASTSTPSLTNNNQQQLARESLQFKFLLSNLVQELKKQHQENKLAAFFNFELLKYEFKYSTTPLVLNANWSNNLIDNTIELNLQYSFNFRKNLSQVNFMIVMPALNKSSSSTDKITLLKSEPTALVQEPDNSKLQILWQMPILNSNGSIMAKFSIPGSYMLMNQSLNSTSLEQFYQPVYVKFNIENETLSQVKFEITSNNYKLSLLKERIETGKYFCNNDHQQLTTMNQHQVTLGGGDDQSLLTNKKPNVVGNLSTSLSTSIGSTVDIFLNN